MSWSTLAWSEPTKEYPSVDTFKPVLGMDSKGNPPLVLDKSKQELKERLAPPPMVTHYTFQQRATQALLPPVIFGFAAYPIYAKKTDALSGRRFSMKNAFLGLPFFLAMIVPSFSAQTVTNEILAKEDDTTLEQLGIGIASGIVASVIYNPAELVVAQQRFTRKDFWPTQRRLLKTHGIGIFGRGLHVTALRDIMSGIGFFTLPPLFTKVLPEEYRDSMLGSLVGATLGGGIAGYLSMPLDTIRDQLHRAPGKKAPSAMSVAKRLHNGNILDTNEKRINFFTGGIWRAAQLALAANVFVFTTKTLENWHTKINNRGLRDQHQRRVKHLNKQVLTQREQQAQRRLLATKERVQQQLN